MSVLKKYHYFDYVVDIAYLNTVYSQFTFSSRKARDINANIRKPMKKNPEQY